MNYEAWRATYQSSEQAARAAFAQINDLNIQLAEVQRRVQLPEIKDMTTSPQLLNMHDRAFWILGWNECRDACKALAAQAKQGGQSND